jgi:hypothetical protein
LTNTGAESELVLGDLDRGPPQLPNTENSPYVTRNRYFVTATHSFQLAQRSEFWYSRARV